MERCGGCRSAGNDRDRQTEIDTQQSFCHCVISNNHSSLVRLFLPLSLVLPFCCFFPPYVGLIEAFRHRVNTSGKIPLRSSLGALCPNAKKKLKQSSSKQASSRRGGFLKLQHQPWGRSKLKNNFLKIKKMMQCLLLPFRLLLLICFQHKIRYLDARMLAWMCVLSAAQKIQVRDF